MSRRVPALTRAPPAGRTDADAVEAPGPTESAAPTPEVEAQAERRPRITLAKSAIPTRVSRVGQVITYRFVVANNGSVTLTDVEITDELEGLSPLTCDPSGATLAAGSATDLHRDAHDHPGLASTSATSTTSPPSSATSRSRGSATTTSVRTRPRTWPSTSRRPSRSTPRSARPVRPTRATGSATARRRPTPATSP